MTPKRVNVRHKAVFCRFFLRVVTDATRKQCCFELGHCYPTFFNMANSAKKFIIDNLFQIKNWKLKLPPHWPFGRWDEFVTSVLVVNKCWRLFQLDLSINLKGPALYAYNDAKFTKDDWRGIRMLCDSVKVKDPMKVGRFGLGFKSVFHLTGKVPLVLSNMNNIPVLGFEKSQLLINLTEFTCNVYCLLKLTISK